MTEGNADVRLRWDRWDWAILGFLLLMGVCQVAFHRRTEFYHWDTCYYLGVAEALARTGRYVFNFLPHVVYPPGMPLLLAFEYLLFGESHTAFIVTMSITGIAGLVLAYFLLRSIGPRWAAGVAVLLVVVSPDLFFLCTVAIGSDTTYLALSMGALGLAVRMDRGRPVRWGSLILSGLVVAAVLVRPAAMTIAVGLLGWLAVTAVFARHRLKPRLRRFLAPALLGLLTLATWLIYVKRVEVLDWPGQYTHSHATTLLMRDFYKPELGRIRSGWELVGRAYHNAGEEGAVLSSYFTGQWVYPSLLSPLVAVVAVLVFVGWWVSVRRNAGNALDWYLAAYAAMFLFWPAPVMLSRYLVPVLPVCLFTVLRGGGQVFGWLRSRPVSVLIAVLVVSVGLAAGTFADPAIPLAGKQGKFALVFWPALALASLLALLLKQAQPVGESVSRLISSKWAIPLALGLVASIGVRQLSRQWPIALHNLAPTKNSSREAEVDAAKWLAANSGAGDVVMAEQESLIHRFSGRRTIQFPPSDDGDLLTEVIRKHGVTWIVVLDQKREFVFEPLQPKRLEVLVKRMPGALILRRQTPDLRIFQIVPAQDVPPPAQPGRG